MANPSQLLLLADHIKLSLLERQRAISLKLEPNAQDREISRSLESLKEGLEKLESTGTSPDLLQAAQRLRIQYTTLHTQFHGSNASAVPPTSPLTTPNDPSLASTFASARTRPSKFVRFTDAPADAEDAANRAALLPYQDDPPDSQQPDHSALDNTQIHAYHTQVLQEQDAQLDSLGASVGRTRDLSVRIGGELDEQVLMLDDVEAQVDRHQSQIERARERVGNIARKAKDNMQLTIIFVLIVILVLLIVVLR